jgi:hypothetical protein
MTPTDYEIVVHGIEHEQHFQGCGVAGTDYTAVFTGIGNNPDEALDDALEQAAMSGWDVDANAKLRRRGSHAVLVCRKSFTTATTTFPCG